MKTIFKVTLPTGYITDTFTWHGQYLYMLQSGDEIRHEGESYRVKHKMVTDHGTSLYVFVEPAPPGVVYIDRESVD